MPVFTSNFTPTLPFKNGHFNTMYRPLFMKDDCNYSRERITTWDADFIDLDFSLVSSKTIVLLIHGLEGSSQSKYMASTSNHLNKKGLVLFGGHTSAKKVSIESDNFKSMTVKDLNNLKVDKVFNEIKINLN